MFFNPPVKLICAEINRMTTPYRGAHVYVIAHPLPRRVCSDNGLSAGVQRGWRHKESTFFAFIWVALFSPSLNLIYLHRLSRIYLNSIAYNYIQGPCFFWESCPWRKKEDQLEMRINEIRREQRWERRSRSNEKRRTNQKKHKRRCWGNRWKIQD